MNQTRRLILAAIGWAWCLAVGELSAQEPHQIRIRPLVRSQPIQDSGLNSNARKTSPAAAKVVANRAAPEQTLAPEEQETFVAVIGAVERPAVFKTKSDSIPLQTLIDRAGGETADSMGSVRILERGVTRFSISLRTSSNRAVTQGQIVYVSPRGGRTLRGVNRSVKPLECWILVTGIAREPVRMNLGADPVTLSELLQKLGQSPEILSQELVVAVAPQGRLVDLETPLATDTVIHIDPAAINREGMLRAIQDGLPVQNPVDLDAVSDPRGPTTPTEEPVPAPRPTRSATPSEQPRRSTLIIPSAPRTQDEEGGYSQSSSSQEIEHTGSRTPSPEPKLLPTTPRTVESPDVQGAVEESETRGQTPIRLPRGWRHAEEDEPADEDDARVINRTSARRGQTTRGIVTAAAEIEESTAEASGAREVARPVTVTNQRASLNTSVEEEWPTEGKQAEVHSSWTTPQSWMVLGVVVAVAVGSVLVTRHLSQKEITDEDIQGIRHPILAETERPEPQIQAQAEESDAADEHRFLQRLILNKVSVIEEDVNVEPVGRLHGQVVGTRRLVFHEAQQSVTGPHFRVRNASDTRDVELRLRKVMRAEAARSTSSSPAGTSQPVVQTVSREPRATTVGALERALRTVEGGGSR